MWFLAGLVLLAIGAAAGYFGIILGLGESLCESGDACRDYGALPVFLLIVSLFSVLSGGALAIDRAIAWFRGDDLRERNEGH